MTLDAALLIIMTDYDRLDPHRLHDSDEKTEAVWIVKSNRAEAYEVDEEWIGVTRSGQILWAYASGCSCWDGDYETAIVKDIKVLQLNHDHSPEIIQQCIIKFAEKNKGIIQLR